VKEFQSDADYESEIEPGRVRLFIDAELSSTIPTTRI
jgi:hypothetical protein